MSARRIILIIAALIITVGTGIVARNWVNSQNATVVQQVVQPEPAKPEGPMVLVAQTDIPTGAFVREGLLRWAEWPNSETLPANYFLDSNFQLEDFMGSVVRRSLSAGEPVLKQRIVRPGQRGFLAAVLRPGYRAMAVRVNATSGIGGLVLPGDRIDMILTHTVGVNGEVGKVQDSDADDDSELKERRDSGGVRVSETILTNVRVLAIDQFINESDGTARVGKTATLEVTPKQAEMLAVVREMGALVLSLRSLAKDDAELARLGEMEDPMEETDPEVGTTYTFDSEVSRLIALKRQVKQTNRTKKVVSVTRGNEVSNNSF